MKTVLGGTGWFTGLALSTFLTAPALAAQTTTMPSTLRYGSGLMDIPVASVLPHMTITGTYSGFFMDLGRSLEIDESGNPIAYGGTVDKFYSDASLAVGLFDRAELGATLQSFDAATAGGDQWGLFGRLQLLQPQRRGIGLAVGGRYVTAPDFADGVSYQPTRLGIADRRFRESYPDLDDVNTELSLYGVASAHIRGLDQGSLPNHDLTFSLGYGTGMFQEGDQLSFYNFADSEGWFFGSAIHFGLGDSSLLTLMGEYNGFDLNIGAELDAGGRSARGPVPRRKLRGARWRILLRVPETEIRYSSVCGVEPQWGSAPAQAVAHPPAGARHHHAARAAAGHCSPHSRGCAASAGGYSGRRLPGDREQRQGPCFCPGRHACRPEPNIDTDAATRCRLRRYLRGQCRVVPE